MQLFGQQFALCIVITDKTSLYVNFYPFQNNKVKKLQTYHMTNQTKPPVLLSNGAKLITFAIAAVLFTFFFYKKDLGLNILFAETIGIFWLLFTRQLRLSGVLPVTAFAAFLLTSVFSIITHSVFVYIMHFISLFIFAGSLIYPQARSLLTTAGLGITNIILSIGSFFEALTTGNKTRGKAGRIIKRIGIFIIPVIIIIVFLSIYSASNPRFNSIMLEITQFLGKYLERIFENINFELFMTFIVVSGFVGMFVFRKSHMTFIQIDAKANDNLIRIRRRPVWLKKWDALKNEYRAGIFLIITLNIILLVVNIIDINWVWFNFKWEGQYLKQFVHEGTYLLILSILISIALVLFFFRGNLNFYSKNKVLKVISYVWLIQNAILVISVAIRNLYYIQYFALAYKRIGVIIFLILTLYGLYSVFMKVRNTRSTYYLIRRNFFAAYVVLILVSLVNWDVVIAKYNFVHYKKSFVHLNFMAELSDKALPYIDVPIEKLNEIDSTQQKKFDFADEDYYLTSSEYVERIHERKRDFYSKWESKDFWEWNYAEHIAYQKLRSVQ